MTTHQAYARLVCLTDHTVALVQPGIYGTTNNQLPTQSIVPARSIATRASSLHNPVFLQKHAAQVHKSITTAEWLAICSVF
jgi:hypothetical protein